MFVTVLETGSFSAAALRLGTSSSQASKLVSKLEQQLGVQLFKRSTRALSPTDVGRSYYERVKNLLDAFEALDASVRESATTPTGRLKISAPGSFGTSVLSQVLVAFARRYPLIELDVSFSDRAVNIVDEGFDMAIRIGTLSDSSLVARKLSEVHVRIAASPVYLEQFGTPQHWRVADGSAGKAGRLPWQRRHHDRQPQRCGRASAHQRCGAGGGEVSQYESGAEADR